LHNATPFSGVIIWFPPSRILENEITSTRTLILKLAQDKMQLGTTERLELPPTADLHVHLRQGELLELIAPTMRKGGVDVAFVYCFSGLAWPALKV